MFLNEESTRYCVKCISNLIQTTHFSSEHSKYFKGDPVYIQKKPDVTKKAENSEINEPITSYN